MPLRAGAPRLKVVLLGWALGFLGTLLPERLRGWLRRRTRPVGAAAIAAAVLRRVAVSLTLLVIFDRFFRKWAPTVRRMDDLRTRLEQELGREPTHDEVLRAWLEEHGYHARST